jgi:hypothetical protein
MSDHRLFVAFTRFRQGQLSIEGLQSALINPGKDRSLNPVQRNLLEQANTRIDAIVLGVCEAERDAHIHELLQETEAKLIAIEP